MTRPALARLSAAGFTQSDLHSSSRIWRETNCYTDLFIEIVHALGLEVEPLLGCALATDFEGDQWTFFKPSHAVLEELYGIQVAELSVWGSFLDRAEVQLARGRVVMPEVDAYHLPDTAGADYRASHSKTAIAITSIDREARRAAYFHNAGSFELDGEDFDALFSDSLLPPYAELIKLDHLERRPQGELLEIALRLARECVRRRPLGNPFPAFGNHLEVEIDRIARSGGDDYHEVTFALVRQCGAAHELAADHLRWLGRAGVGGLDEAVEAFAEIAQTAQVLVLKAARVVRSGRSANMAADCQELAAAWERGWAVVVDRIAP